MKLVPEYPRHPHRPEPTMVEVEPIDPPLTQAEVDERLGYLPRGFEVPALALAGPEDYLTDSEQEIGLAEIFEDEARDHLLWLERISGTDY